MPKKLAFSLLLGSLLSAAALYLAFRNVPFVELIAYLKKITYIWLAPSIALVLLSFVLRVYRWRLILKAEVALGFWPAFHPLMIAFMVNCVLPGRIGELARPLILKKEHGVPFGTGLATVAAERLFDMLFLIALLAAVFPFVTDRPDLEVAFGGVHLNHQRLQMAAWAVVRISILLLIGLGLLAFWPTRRRILRLIEGAAGLAGRVVPVAGEKARRAGYLLSGLIEGFARGLKLVGDPARAAACVFLTVMIWLVSIVSLYVFALGCPGIDLTILETAVMLTVICFFIALPSVPGYWGLWEAGGVFALLLLGTAPQDAAGFTLANHAVQIFPVILIGWISALLTSINIRQFIYADKTENTGRENVFKRIGPS